MKEEFCGSGWSGEESSLFLPRVQPHSFTGVSTTSRPTTCPRQGTGYSYHSQAALAPRFDTWDSQAALAPRFDTWDSQAALAPRFDTWDSQAASAPRLDTWDSQAALAPRFDTWDSQAPTAPRLGTCDSQDLGTLVNILHHQLGANGKGDEHSPQKASKQKIQETSWLSLPPSKGVLQLLSITDRLWEDDDRVLPRGVVRGRTFVDHDMDKSRRDQMQIGMPRSSGNDEPIKAAQQFFTPPTLMDAAEIRRAATPHPGAGHSPPIMPTADSDSNLSQLSGDKEDAASEEGNGDKIIVGLSDLTCCGATLSDFSLLEGDTPVPIKSNSGCLFLSDVLRLTRARAEAPLSFGSVQHHATKLATSCRACMFEQRPGRCKKSWLCDFCHLRHPRREKASRAKQPRAASPT